MTDKEEDKLKGEQNYFGWLRAVQASLAEKGCFRKAELKETKSQEANGIKTFPGREIDSNKEDTALAVVTKNVSQDILGLIPPDVQSAMDILNWLQIRQVVNPIRLFSWTPVQQTISSPTNRVKTTELRRELCKMQTVSHLKLLVPAQ